MKKGQYVILTKIDKAPDALSPTPSWERYVPGGDNGQVSLPISYTAEGTLVVDVVEGNSIVLDRTKRNGVSCPGILRTTEVTRLQENNNGDLTAVTLNSIYLLQTFDAKYNS